MMLRVRHQVAPDSAPAESQWLAPLLHSVIGSCARSCCCPAPAAYAVVVPPSTQLPAPPELLLCGHHLRASRTRLDAAGAAVYDAVGRLVES